jgi:hypothetical protein
MIEYACTRQSTYEGTGSKHHAGRSGGLVPSGSRLSSMPRSLARTTTLRQAFSSLEQALSNTAHVSCCTCVTCAAQSHAFIGTRGLHSTPITYRVSSPKVVLRSDLPPNWAYTGTIRENAKSFAEKMRDYRAQVAVLRNEWRPLVDKHNQEVCSAAVRSNEVST